MRGPPLSFLLLVLIPATGTAQDAAALAARIDEAMEKTWRSERLTPSPRASDEEFLRRCHLDITGLIPAAQKARDFIDSKQRNKRDLLVGELLESKGYSRHWSTVWSNLLIGRAGEPIDKLARLQFQQWLDQRFAAGAPLNVIVHELLTAQGTVLDNPPVYWTIYHDASAEELTGAAARHFLGTQIQCAQCHDHPFEKWKQTDFYGMAAFFGRVQQQRVLGIPRIADVRRGDVRLGGMTDAPIVAPRYLDGVNAKNALFLSRRKQLADWVTASENKLFARAMVNRMWAQFFGRGLVDPVDDMGDSNPAVYPEVLEQLADAFVAADYDPKFLIRVMTKTKAYHLTSMPSRNNQDDWTYFSRAYLKRLTPEELIGSVIVSTGVGANEKLMESPLFQLMLESVKQDFVFVFGNMDEAEEVSEFKGTIAQALMMMNSKHAARVTDWKLFDPISLKLRTARSLEACLEWLYLSTLSRRPSIVETRGLSRYLRGASGVNERLEICEDIYWSLLNCSEFAFNH